MKKNFLYKLLTVTAIFGLVVGSVSTSVKASVSAGAATALHGASSAEINAPLSGVPLMMSETLSATQGGESEFTGDLALNSGGLEITKRFVEPTKPDIDYKSTAISVADDYVNVRFSADENSDVVGKFYKDCAGTVVGSEGEWTKISSGNVEGFVRNDFLSVGDKTVIDDALKYHAKVTADALKLRSEMSTESEVLSVARNGVNLEVLDDSSFNDGWIRVQKKDTEAFVSSQFVDLAYEFNVAETPSEEYERLQRESTNAGMQVANFALQFVGNPYVWGGTSLTNGADCSGFIMSVYANFGIYLPHSSAADRNVGRPVKTEDMQAGDIVCYSGHVALCIGNGMIVHAASRRSGIKVSSAYYRNILCVRRVL